MDLLWIFFEVVPLTHNLIWSGWNKHIHGNWIQLIVRGEKLIFVWSRTCGEQFVRRWRLSGDENTVGLSLSGSFQSGDDSSFRSLKKMDLIRALSLCINFTLTEFHWEKRKLSLPSEAMTQHLFYRQSWLPPEKPPHQCSIKKKRQ